MHDLQPFARARIEDLLYEEARLLDRHDYSGWLGLLTDDATYSVPIGDADRDVAIVRETRDHLEERIMRLEGDHAFAQEPRSNTARQIGNVQVTVDGDRAHVEAVATVTEFRRDVQRLYAGRCHYTVVTEGDELRIAAKRVELVDQAGALGNLSLLL